MRKILLLNFLMLISLTGYSQLVFNTGATAQDLVNNLLGPGITATNITYTGAAASKATFTCTGSCSIGFPSGIMLSTGNLNGPTAPASVGASTGMGTAGDAQLNLISSPTFDAAVLEFDFQVPTDSVKFEFIFGSEEYNEYVNTIYNDVFAFYISGPGIVGVQNMALLPGTSTPVAINSINNGNSAGVASGPCMNCQYYVDNVGGSGYFLDGHTTVLTARAAVQPCETYHMKIAIADVSDGILDSGVLLKENSFTAIGTVTVFANSNPIANNGIYTACAGSTVNLCLSPATTYNWANGATTQCLTVTEQNLAPNGLYQAIFMGPNGCFATSSVTVQFATPTATITPSGSLNLCPGSNVTLTANPGSSYLWSTGATTQSVFINLPGTYTVTVSQSPGCSAVSTPVTVTVGNATAQITGVLSLCDNASTTLSANVGQSYLWNTGAVTQTINVSTAGSYTVTVTQPGGCSASATVNVQVNANPTPAIAGILSICQGENTTLTATAGFSSYQWSTGGLAASLNVTSSGTYTVTVTDAGGCTGTTSATVVVNPLPVPVISGNLAFCTGSSSNLDAGSGYSTYLWNTGDVTQVLPVTTSGTYTVTVTTANNCSASTSVVVTVNSSLIPVITGTFDFCQGANTILSATPGFATYQWNTGAVTPNITVSTSNTFTVTVTDANGCSGTTSQVTTVNPNPTPVIAGITTICQGETTTFSTGPFSSYSWSTGASSSSVSLNTSGTYTVIVTDANGCSGTTSASLTVHPLPVPVISGNLSFCSGNNSNLNAGNGYSSYLWNTGDVTQVLPVTASGTYTVTVTTANNCSASTSAVVTVYPTPVPAITGTFSFCQGTNTILNATPGFATYQWNTGAVTPGITVSTSNTFTVTVTDANGCTGTTSQITTVNPNPTPVIAGVTAICQGETTSFSTGPYSSYSWSTGASSSSVSLNTAGTYTVTVTDANGCSGTTSSSLTVHPLPVPSISGTTTFCQGLNSNLNAGNGFSTYLWNTGDVTQTLNVSASGNYTVTVTSAFGCSASTSTLVTVNPLPTPVITGPVSICIGNSATLNAGSGYSSYLWSNGETTQTISTSQAGTYTVTVASGAGCSANTSASLTVNPLPTPVISGITTICQGETTSLDAGAGYNSYLWSTGANTQTINTGTAGIVTVTVSDANGCSSPATTSVTVNALPVPVISGLNAFCDGLSGTLDAGGGFSTYLWNTGAITRTINVSTAGTYTVTVTASTGCQGADTENVTVHPNPVPVILGGTGICQGTSTILTIPGSYSTYLWNTGETTSNISVSSAGNYSATVTTAFGCVGSTSTVMVINPLPSPVITGVTAICQGATTTFDAGSGYSAYLWSTGATGQTISPGVAGSYTVIVTDANGCQNDTGISLVVNPLPTPAITGIMEFCLGDNSNLNAGGGYVSYLWNNGSASQVISVNTAGNYIVTVTDNNGCVASTSAVITVNALPVPVITGINAICDGTTTTFNAGNYSSYVWSDGSTAQTITTGTAGTYEVTVTDANGCVGGTTQTLTVYQLPTAVISGNNSICSGQSTALNFTFTGDAPFTYTYVYGTTTSPLQTSNSLTASINVSPGSSTTYGLLTISDAHCQGSVSGSAAITVNPLPLPVISGDLSICDGETTSLTATPGFVSYTWSNSFNQPSIVTGVSGSYTVTVTDLNGCVGTSPAVNLVVNAVPVVSFTNDTSLTCAVPKINFTNQSVYVSGSIFEWTFGDGGGSNAANPSHLYFVPGTYPVSLTITTPAGCVSSASANVEIMFYPLPVADFVTSPGITNVFNAKVGFVDRSDYAVTWLWEFGDGDKSTEQNPYHYFNEVGDYRVALTVTNIAGCVDRHEEYITINPFFIPNAFTPNGDGVNDLFYYSGYDLDVASYRMNIFNRWGQLVFTGEHENDNWNGETQTGEIAPTGTYVYRLEVKTRGGKEHVFQGHVNIVR